MNQIIKVAYNGQVKFIETASSVADACRQGGVDTSQVLVSMNGQVCDLADEIEFEDGIAIISTSKKQTGGK